MKKSSGLFLLALLLAGGCTTRYDITTTTGIKITTQGKPKYDKSRSTWTYIDMKGQPHEIASGSVTLVQPQSMETPDPKAPNPMVKK
jgi:hypothetical protein